MFIQTPCILTCDSPSPLQVCRINMTCCVLHNIAMKRGVPLPPQSQHSEDVRPDAMMGPDCRRAVHVRAQLIAHLWRNTQFQSNSLIYLKKRINKKKTDQFQCTSFTRPKSGVERHGLDDGPDALVQLRQGFGVCCSPSSPLRLRSEFCDVFFVCFWFKIKPFFFTSSIVRPSPDTASTVRVTASHVSFLFVLV